MRWAILKIKEGLAYLSLDLIYDLKGKSQNLFRGNVPLRGIFMFSYLCLTFKGAQKQTTKRSD
jgi:hypothetical protein